MSNMDDQFKAALSRWASGVAVILVDTDLGPRGITISAFMSGSLHPPLVCFAINNNADFMDLLNAAEHFTLNMLSTAQSEDSNFWAGWSDVQSSKLITKNGLSYIEGASVHMHLKHNASHDCGDHRLFIAEMLHAESLNETPLIFYRGAYGL